MARSRDLGDAHVIGEGRVAIAVRAFVSLADSDDGTAWSGRLRPYRPLALRPGRYQLRVRGDDVGALHVRGGTNQEVVDFLGEGPPSAALRQLFTAGGPHTPGGSPRFPKVAGAAEPTPAGRLLSAFGAGLRGVLRAPLRLVRRRRRLGMATRGRR